MKKDYRVDLEKAARQMILVHRMDTLIRLILRILMRNIRVTHAVVMIYDKTKNEYVAEVSKGEKGIKIPAGFVKVKKGNPLIRYFTEPTYKVFDQDFLLADKLNYYLRYSKSKGARSTVKFLEDLKDVLSLYRARTAIPCMFRENLIGVFMLGSKESGSGFKPEELGFLSVLASDVAMAVQNTWLFEDLNRQLEANKKLFLSTVTTLATAIEAKDKYTSGHTERVVSFSLGIVDNIKNTGIADWKRFRENLSIAALLHDIGKIAVPEKILNKRGPLTDKERTYLFRHPIAGNEILNPIREFSDVVLGVKYHHERYDGKGYPFALKGNDIPMVAAIIAVADTFDAMTSDRPYRKALPERIAIAEIRKNRGKQFDPRVVDAFLRFMAKRKKQEERRAPSLL